jgi:hypothetical protein
MRFEAFSALSDIRRRWPIENGKILQLLLAISFDRQRGGYSVINRLSQGVDLEMTSDANKFAVEVKTTEDSQVSLEEKDIIGLRAKAADGYVPAVAALRLLLSENWVIAEISNFDRFPPGTYAPVRLSRDSIPDLESSAKRHFEKVVVEFRDSILSPPGGRALDFRERVLHEESRYHLSAV